MIIARLTCTFTYSSWPQHLDDPQDLRPRAMFAVPRCSPATQKDSSHTVSDGFKRWFKAGTVSWSDLDQGLAGWQACSDQRIKVRARAGSKQQRIHYPGRNQGGQQAVAYLLSRQGLGHAASSSISIFQAGVRAGSKQYCICYPGNDQERWQSEVYLLSKQGSG